MVDPVLAWLARHQANEPGYDQGGIVDSLDGRVAGTHYGATHFAWSCALGYKGNGDSALLDAARRAVAFHLRTSPEEYSLDNWSYHWDFNNLAFIETFLLLTQDLEEDERRTWIAGLKSWKTNQHWAVNWVAMRALAHFMRHDLLGNPEDLASGKNWLAFVLESQEADGAINDVRGKSLPSQYHAYTACLLHRMLGRHPSVPGAVKNAARWLLAITSPDGEMNALGRGQGQIFGYACAVYLFRAAVDLDPDLAPNYRWAARAVLARMAEFQTGEGWWPLVLNCLPVENKAGWYDYHHLSVYNAFAAVWLSLAQEVFVPPGPAEPPAQGVIWLKESGLLAARCKRWFVLFSAGHEGAGYLTEAGITPHQIYWEGHDLFRYPLGPGTGKYGENASSANQEVHCWAPLWRRDAGPWQAPSGAAGSLAPNPDIGGWRLRLDAGGAAWRRDLVLGRRFLEARDVLALPSDDLGGAFEIRVQNIALDAARPRREGKTFVQDSASKAVLRVWGGEGLALVGEVESAWGRSDVLASAGSKAGSSGWRLRQGPSDAPGKLPGIVCLSWDPWSGLWKRKQRLLFELARSGRSPKTLFIEPSSTITQVVEGLTGIWSKRGARHRRCLGGRLTHMGHALHLASPLLPWPGQRSFPSLAQANRRAWLKQLRRFVRLAKFAEGYVLWLYHPSQLDALDVLGDGAELVVYDWTDDWPRALPPDRSDRERRDLEGKQHELLCRADVVFAVSQELAERARVCCPHVHLLPNATDPAVFKPHDPAAPSHLLAARRPLLVYLSQITERLDVDLVRQLAQARPDWTVVLAGPVVCDPERLAGLSGLQNVVMSGPLPYDEAASLVAQANVCLLPHTEDALTRTLDPIKLYDYLATGRPIVSTDVAMHTDLAGLVRVASGPEAFVAAVEAALNEQPGLSDRRIEAARNHTWQDRAEIAASVLERFFPED